MAITRDVLAGLHAAHEARRADGLALEIVHRDVSPHNILVGFDGVARITDFGVAKATWRRQATELGAVKGKLGYMAPEQLDGRADRRADLYSAGVVLWELLTGRRLRPADGGGAQVLVQILHGMVTPPSEDAPDAAILDDVTMRALRCDPDERFSTTLEMAERLVERVAPASSERVAEVLGALLGGSAAPGALPSSTIESTRTERRLPAFLASSSPTSSSRVRVSPPAYGLPPSSTTRVFTAESSATNVYVRERRRQAGRGVLRHRREHPRRGGDSPPPPSRSTCEDLRIRSVTSPRGGSVLQ